MKSTLQQKSQYLWRSLLSFCYPPHCACCQSPSSFSPGGTIKDRELEGFCQICRKGLFRNDTHNCQICGHPLLISLTQPMNESSSICSPCQRSRPIFRQAQSAFVYEGTIRKTLHHFKYQGNRVAGRVLQECFGTSIDQLSLPWREYHFALPVPLHPKRLHQRGFQQAWLLLQALSLPSTTTKHPSILEKWKHTESQMGLSKQERKDNLQESIRINPNLQSSIINSRVLLIDDVLTTGTTANVCSRVLLNAGAECVDVLTLCRAVF